MLLRRKFLASTLALPWLGGHAQLHAAGAATGSRFLWVF